MNTAIHSFRIRGGIESDHAAPRRLSILIGADVPPDPNAGASGTVWQMAEALRRRGHHVETFWADDLGRRIQHGNLHYLLELPFTYRREVRRRTRDSNYDVIELNQPHAYLAAMEHRRSGRPGVFVNRSHGHEVRSEEALTPWRQRLQVEEKKGVRKWISARIRRLLDRQWEQIAQQADGFVVSCREDQDFIAERYGVVRERIGRITQGVPQAYFDRPVAPQSEDRRQKLIYVGQFAFLKAPQMLARAVSQILLRRPNATMTWICKSDHHRLALALLDDPVRSRIHLMDWMPQDQLISVLDQHGIFLFPSYFEGFGKAPLEAMARGLCVVASSCGGMRDYIDHDHNGLLVPVGRPEEMTAAALSLVDNPSDFRRISTAARMTAAGHTWDRCAADAERFYCQLLDRKRAQNAQVRVFPS